MPCTNQDNTAHTYDPHLAATAERSPGRIEAPRPQLMAVRDSASPTLLATHESADRSNWLFNRLVIAGLAVLVILLAAVMLNAGINVEVLP